MDPAKQIHAFGYPEQTEFTVELRPTSKCNYDCYYCTDLHINGNPIIHLDSASVSRLVEYARRMSQLPIHIFICGGEPTVYNKLLTLVNDISISLNDDEYITIQTNMHRSLKWFRDFACNLTNKKAIRINGSYHNTQNVNRLSFIKKCLYLKSVNVLGMVSFGYNKQRNVLDDYNFGVKMLGNDHCEVTPLINASVDQDPHKGNGSGDDIDYLYAVEDMTKFKSYGHFFEDTLPYTLTDGVSGRTTRGEMWLARKNNFLGSKCSVSRYKIYVDWDGSCYRCFNEQFSPGPAAFHIDDTAGMDIYFSNLKCMNCPYTTCFLDLEYRKESQSTPVEEIKINRQYNTIHAKAS